jgi:ABC-type nitrate/sulfonate/bicarbonate transport system substrate-binding protein
VGGAGIERPRDLEGRTVGVSGLPSEPAFLRAILEHDGADYRRVRQVTIVDERPDVDRALDFSLSAAR